MRRGPQRAALRPSLFFATAIAAAAALTLPWSSSSSRWGGHTWLSAGLRLPCLSTTRRLLARRSSSGTDTPTQAESYLLSWGLSEQQLDKVRARYGQNLNFNPDVEHKVKPLLKWLADLGLTQVQIQKAVVDFPVLFRQHLEQQLKPCVRWLLEMGLDRSNVAKMIAREPRLCSRSIERTLKPFVGWLSELGIEKSQIAKAIANQPQICGLSLENNLKPKVRLLGERGFSQAQIARTLGRTPVILGLSLKRLTHRTSILEAQGLLAESSLGTAKKMTEANFASRFE
mmetsp:Transcript_102410/g.330414  ORF Transcript_102410/g.330414 Transcript_102410/m.330414 type:complete len:286 (+) Transcript_102410:89-946(+)